VRERELKEVPGGLFKTPIRRKRKEVKSAKKGKKGL
jgi:hypothetical protein